MKTLTFEQLENWRPERPAYGVVGSPISHSLSPVMQQAALDHLGIPADYVAFDIPVERLPAALGLMERAGVAGVNLTIPHKVEVMKLLSSASDEASKIGACNTLLLREGQRIGHNTDARGFSKAIPDVFHINLRDLRIMVVGCGGAGRSIAFQCAKEKCERLVLVNRTVEKAVALKNEVSFFLHSDKLLGPSDRLRAIALDSPLLQQEVGQMDMIVNATSSGLKPGDSPPLSPELIQPHHLVYDIIYRPAITPLLAAAADAGARTANGLSMLLHQGALAFEIWHGKSAPLDIMRAALEKHA